MENKRTAGSETLESKTITEELLDVIDTQLGKIETKARILEIIKETLTEATNALVLQRDFYDGLCSSLHTAIIVLDRSQRIRFMNEQAVTLIGNDLPVFEMRSFQDIFRARGTHDIHQILSTIAVETGTDVWKIQGFVQHSEYQTSSMNGRVSRMHVEGYHAGYIIELDPSSVSGT